MFNPVEFLKEQRRHDPVLDAAHKKAEGSVRTYLDPLIKFFDGLETEIKEMPIASRFRRDLGPIILSQGQVNPDRTKGPNEAEYKRKQLLGALKKIRGIAEGLDLKIESLVLDIEATKTEDIPAEEHKETTS